MKPLLLCFRPIGLTFMGFDKVFNYSFIRKTFVGKFLFDSKEEGRYLEIIILWINNHNQVSMILELD